MTARGPAARMLVGTEEAPGPGSVLPMGPDREPPLDPRAPSDPRATSGDDGGGDEGGGGGVGAGSRGSDPQFGPSGYLPDRAARRARKIVLRAPLGLQWVVASLVAGLVVVVAGVLLLGRGTEPPAAPWTAIGAVQDLPASAYDPGTGLLVVHVAGRVRAFDAPEGIRYCSPSNRLEHPDGRVWALTGRGLAGTPSLAPAPTLTIAGIAYLDPTAIGTPLEPLGDPAEPAC